MSARFAAEPVRLAATSARSVAVSARLVAKPAHGSRGELAGPRCRLTGRKMARSLRAAGSSTAASRHSPATSAHRPRFRLTEARIDAIPRRRRLIPSRRRSTPRAGRLTGDDVRRQRGAVNSRGRKRGEVAALPAHPPQRCATLPQRRLTGRDSGSRRRELTRFRAAVGSSRHAVAALSVPGQPREPGPGWHRLHQLSKSATTGPGCPRLALPSRACYSRLLMASSVNTLIVWARRSFS
jgi:hypothetical protein